VDQQGRLTAASNGAVVNLATETTGTLSVGNGGTGATTAATARTGLGLGLVENTALSTWPGSTNITTLGTVTTGTVPVARVTGLGSLASLSTINNSNWSGAALAVGNGGTGSTTQNFVDLTSGQTIAGAKVFSSTITGSVSGTAANVTGTVAVGNGGTGLTGVGGNGTVLTVVSGAPAWAAPAVGPWSISGSNIINGNAGYVEIANNLVLSNPTGGATAALQIWDLAGTTRTPFLHAYGSSNGLGGNNVFLGNGAGNFTLGSGATKNTGVGALALAGLNGGSDNTALGASALKGTQVGSYNVAIGSGAISGGSFSGSSNVVIGVAAGNNLFNGSSNLIFGYGAGQSITDGANNIVLGTSADTAPTLSNQIAIGYQAKTTKANQMVLGADGSDLSHPALVEVVPGGDNTTSLGTATNRWSALFLASPVAITQGGTGAISASAALNALLPSQTSNGGKFLTTDGGGSISWSSVTSWNTAGPNTTSGSLTITGTGGVSSGWSGFELDQFGGSGTPSGNDPFSISASQNIKATNFMAVSDARVKDVVGRSDGAADLANLQRIQITDYRYKDRVQYGDAVHKKVIAQEVEAVYPIAVKQTVDFLPNIYRMSAMVSYTGGRLTVAMAEPHDLQGGEIIRLIGENGALNLPVTEVLDGTHFVVANYPVSEEKVFVYGTQVKDFRVVDYEALGTLNISATQELARQMKALQDENAALKRDLAEIKALLKR
jgi:hypothetical protein